MYIYMYDKNQIILYRIKTFSQKAETERSQREGIVVRNCNDCMLLKKVQFSHSIWLIQHYKNNTNHIYTNQNCFFGSQCHLNMLGSTTFIIFITSSSSSFFSLLYLTPPPPSISLLFFILVEILLGTLREIGISEIS